MRDIRGGGIIAMRNYVGIRVLICKHSYSVICRLYSTRIQRVENVES